MPSHAGRGIASPRARARIAVQTGCVQTRATDEATLVNDRLGIHVPKWAASSTPAATDFRLSVGESRATSRRRRTTAGLSTPDARALRQKAIANAGTAASRMSGADVDTA